MEKFGQLSAYDFCCCSTWSMALVLWLSFEYDTVEHYTQFSGCVVDAPSVMAAMYCGTSLTYHLCANESYVCTAALVDYPDTLQSYLRLMSTVHFAFVVLFSYYNNAYPSFHLSTYSHIILLI